MHALGACHECLSSAPQFLANVYVSDCTILRGLFALASIHIYIYSFFLFCFASCTLHSRVQTFITTQRSQTGAGTLQLEFPASGYWQTNRSFVQVPHIIEIVADIFNSIRFETNSKSIQQLQNIYIAFVKGAALSNSIKNPCFVVFNSNFIELPVKFVCVCVCLRVSVCVCVRTSVVSVYLCQGCAHKINYFVSRQNAQQWQLQLQQQQLLPSAI